MILSIDYISIKKIGKKPKQTKKETTTSRYMQKNWTTWKTGRILKKYNLSRLNQEEIENMNRPMTNTKIETMI